MDVDKAIQLALDNHQSGNLQQAENIYREILRDEPNNFYALHYLGILYYQLRNYDAAIKYIRKASELNPTAADAFYNLGNVYKDSGHLDEAINCFQKSLELNPQNADAYNNQGIIYKDKGELNEAITSFQEAIHLNPNHIIAYYNLGVIYKDKKQFDEAIQCFQKVLLLNPNIIAAYHYLGIIYQEKEQIDEAITQYQKAIQLNPNIAELYSNLGLVLIIKGKHTEAISCYQKAIAINPDDSTSRWLLSNIFLLIGDYRNGWKEFESFRKIGNHNINQRTFTQPLWDGSDIKGLTILLHAEAGFGDTIQFIRYVPLIAQRGAKVIVDSQKELTSLLQNVDSIDAVFSRGDKLPEFDLHCPLMSLPRIFDTTLDNIPLQTPYLKADDLLVRKWSQRLQGDASRLKVGLVWSGGGFPPKKSTSLDKFSSFKEIEKITFYSLQKGPSAEQTKYLQRDFRCIDYTDGLHDFSETAALIANLDLVISVDTAVAHLAGALGKPVWVLLPFVPDWRWLLNRDDSPWYPTMRLFRQPSLGDWVSVIVKVKDELMKLLDKN